MQQCDPADDLFVQHQHVPARLIVHLNHQLTGLFISVTHQLTRHFFELSQLASQSRKLTVHLAAKLHDLQLH